MLAVPVLGGVGVTAMIADLDHWRLRLEAAAAAEAGDDASHDLGHLRRVWRNAQNIMAEEPQADALVVLAAAYLHDCVCLPKDHPERARASTLAAARAEAILAGLAFPVSIPAVVHAIHAHSFSAGIEPRTLEAEIVQDADRIEALGAIGVARCFFTGGRLGSQLFDAADPAAERRELDDRRYCLDHFAAKLLRLPASMRTAGGRRLAAERAVAVVAFRAQLLQELA